MFLVDLLTVAALLVCQSGDASVADRVAKRVADTSNKLQLEYEASLALRPDRTRFEDGFLVTRPHYRVRCNENFHIAALVADSLEKMLPQFAGLVGSELRGGTAMNVFVFKTIEEYNTFGTNNGAHHSSNFGGFFSAQHAERPIATYVWPQETDDPKYTLFWATHGAFHQFLASVSPTTLPTWLEEGLASYFELFYRPDPWSEYVPSLGERWEKGLPVPLGQLVSDGVERYTPEHYQEIGAFLYYLMFLREDTRDAVFREFLRKTLRGETESNSLVMQAVFGDPAATEKDFVALLKKSGK